MIEIVKSPNADSRSATGKLTPEVLTKSTESHIKDVTNGLNFIADLIKMRSQHHDHTKLEMMNDFCEALNSGKIKESNWYQTHISEERHHLKSRVPDDVNLIDVIEHVVDCSMAGLARSGEIYDVDLSPEVLQLAIKNTVELLKNNTKIVDPEKDLFDEEI